MSVKLSIAALAHPPAGVAVPKYRRSDLKPGILHIGVGNFHRAHQAVYLDDLFNAGARPRLGARRRGRARAGRRHAREARGAGLADDGRRAGGGGDDRARHRRDDRFRSAVRRRGESRGARRPGDPHRVADRDGGRLLHFARDPALRPGSSGYRRRRQAAGRAENRLRPDRGGPQAPPRRRRSALHRDVLRQHSRQRPCDRERGRGPRRAFRSRARAMDPGERRLPQLDGRPHHARPRPTASARILQRDLWRRGQLAGVLRGVPAMGGRGQVPGRTPGAGDGRRDLHRRRRAL